MSVCNNGCHGYKIKHVRVTGESNGILYSSGTSQDTIMKEIKRGSRRDRESDKVIEKVGYRG